MMLGKRPVPGVRLIWIIARKGHTELAVGAVGDVWTFFSLVYYFSFLSPSLWQRVRYRLKYCLKGPLSPKQPTNQLSPFTEPCRIVFAQPEDIVVRTNHFIFRFLTKVRSSSNFPMAARIFLRTSSLGTWSLYKMFINIWSHLIQRPSSFSLALLSRSQAYINMYIIRKRISFTFDLRVMLLSVHIGFSFCTIDVLRQTACLVVNPIKVNSFAYLFNCTTVGWDSD